MEAMGHEPQSGTSATAAGERARRWWILGRPSVVPPDSWRRRLRNRPVVAEAYRCAVFALGLLLIASGIALAVLPGPLTIPPVVLGLWVWSACGQAERGPNVAPSGPPVVRRLTSCATWNMSPI